MTALLLHARTWAGDLKHAWFFWRRPWRARWWNGPPADGRRWPWWVAAGG